MTEKRSTTLSSPAEAIAAKGQVLGVSDWLTIEQQRIDQFADATGDHQWIHCDPAMAAKGPFGATIAHGYLTLSLVPYFAPQVVQWQGVRMGINYGANKVRFPMPVRVGSRVRAHFQLIDAEPVEPQGLQLVMQVTIEIEGAPKPACIAEVVSRVHW